MKAQKIKKNMNDVRVRLHKDDTDVNRLMAFAVTQLSGKKKKK